MEIQFYLSEERKKKIPVRGLKALQAAQRHREPLIEGLCDVLATFMCDSDDNYLERAQADDILDALSGEQLGETIEQFTEAWKEFTLPKAKRSHLPRPSSTAEAAPGG